MDSTNLPISKLQQQALKDDNFELLRYLKFDFEKNKDEIFVSNAVNVLKAVSFPLEQRHTYVAAFKGDLEYLKILHCNKCLWDHSTCASAAMSGHLVCLKYAHENGCEWDWRTCSSAAKGGYLDCLKYAHENGYKWDKWTYAAEGGYFNCLKYACENGCKWDKSTCTYAAKGGHLDCLKYARENGCSIDITKCLHKAYKNKHVTCAKYLYNELSKQFN